MRFGALRSAARPKSALLAATRPDEALDRPPGPREQAGRPVDRTKVDPESLRATQPRPDRMGTLDILGVWRLRLQLA
jgi:hypothetical protein